MINAEKFEEVFGFEPNYAGCITAKCINCPLDGTTVLGHCNTNEWWASEYKGECRMTVKELKDKLSKFPDDMEVFTKKTDFCGNIGIIFSVREDKYSFFGSISPCILLTDESDEGEEG